MLHAESKSSGGRIASGARVALGLIRLANGTAALVAPTAFGRRLAIEAETSPAVSYVTRMFGVRTMLIGFDLLRRDSDARRRALEVAPLIHASDACAAALAAASGRLPRRVAVLATAISSLNTVLAVTARRSARL